MDECGRHSRHPNPETWSVTKGDGQEIRSGSDGAITTRGSGGEEAGVQRIGVVHESLNTGKTVNTDMWVII